MSCETESKNINLEELEIQLKDASKGIAKVDKKYVDYDTKGHLFDYNLDFPRFYEDIGYILERLKFYRENRR